MNKILLFCFSLFATCAFSQSDLVITGTFDGPLPGGLPKGVEIYALDDISDLSIYAIGSANNGGGSDGEEYTFPASGLTAGSFIYVVTESAPFNDFFGFTANFEAGDAMNINGDDAVELFMNGNVVDVFGDINTDGTGTAWEHLDGWAYRNNGTGPDGASFNVNNWSFSGIDAFDGASTNRDASTPMPLGTYRPDASTSIGANPDFIEIEINTSATINLTENDDIPNGFDSIVIADAPTNGVVALIDDGNITYTPTQDFCGADGFTYTICSMGECSTTGVRINVICPIIFTPSTIAGVTMLDADGNAVSADSTVALTGIVHSVNFRSGGLQFALIDENNDGINVFSNSDPLGYTVTEGDNVTVNGEISQFRGLSQVTASEVIVNSSGNALFDPTEVTALNEETESQLVVIRGVSVVDASQWTNTGTGFNVDVTDGANVFAMRIVDATNVFGTSAPQGTFDLVGIGGQFDFDAPFFDGYQIFPRTLDDIQLVSSTNDVRLSSEIVVAPNPAIDFLTVNGLNDFEQITVLNSVGQSVGIFNQNTIEVSHLPSGIYFLQIENKGERLISSFVKR